MNTKIDWFQIPSNDFERAVQFYETIFDTTLRREKFGDSPMGIFSGAAGDSIGAVIQGDGYQAANAGTVVYFDAAPVMDDVIERIKKAGGQVLIDKFALPNNIGYVAHFLDTEGNRLALHSRI
jgi:predicted enzyme related to lactoylglutathione lyase